MKYAEFDGLRAKLYEEAIASFPQARCQDVDAMYLLLNPKEGDKIIGIGEGNGYFCKQIANKIGQTGKYLVTDPSQDQLDNLVQRVKPLNIQTQTAGAQEIQVPKNYFDKVWSFGAFHHCASQREAMEKIYGSLKEAGKLVLCDVFQDSNLAKHFDSFVAKYCITGHEVKFLSEEYAKTICEMAGFKKEKVKFIDLKQEWLFKSEHDLGEFIYKLHALTLIPGTYEEQIRQTIQSCREILGVKYNNNNYALNWSMKALIAEK